MYKRTFFLKQAPSSADLSAQNVADFLNEVLDVVTAVDNVVLDIGGFAIDKKANLLAEVIGSITGTG